MTNGHTCRVERPAISRAKIRELDNIRKKMADATTLNKINLTFTLQCIINGTKPALYYIPLALEFLLGDLLLFKI